MAKRNYISEDFATKQERARRKIDRRPPPRRLPALPRQPVPPIVSSLFRVYNNASETIPEFAPMQVEEFGEYTGFTGTHDAYSVTQATSTGTEFLINAGGEIPAGYFGAGTLTNEPEKVLFDTGASPSLGDRCAPSPGTWYMTTDSQGEYIALGDSGDDDDTVIVIRRQTKPDSLVIGVTLGSTAATTATVTSRPPSWDTVPGETAGIVSITNPSSISLSTDSLSLHAAYCERNSTEQWELIGDGRGSGGAVAVYGGLYGGISSPGFNSGSTYATFSALQFQITGGFNVTVSTTNYSITIQETAVYQVSFKASIQADTEDDTHSAVDFGLVQNNTAVGGQALSTLTGASLEAFRQCAFSSPIALTAGDVLKIRADTQSNDVVVSRASFTVSKIGT